MAQVAPQQSPEQLLAELEDTATSSKSNAGENKLPEYRTEKDQVQQPATSPEKEAIPLVDGKHQPANPVKKKPTDDISDEKHTLDTTPAPGVEGKELVTHDTKSALLSSPSTSSATNTSQFGLGRQPSRSYHEYSFWHTAPWRPTHNVVTDPEHTGRYFVEVSEFTKGKQDVSIHDIAEGDPVAASKGDGITTDEGKATPVVAFAQFPNGNNNLVRLGLGDPNNMGSVKWVNMTTEPESKNWTLFVPLTGHDQDTTKEYHFWSTKPMPSGPEVEASTPSTVQSTQSFSTNPTVGNYKFTAADSNTTLAIYSENKLAKTWKKRGKLRMYERDSSSDVSPEQQELLIILCCAVTNEKRRRRTWKKWVLMG